MIENKIKKEFIEFLKQNNALKEYKENLIKHKGKLYPEDIIQYAIDPFHTIIKAANSYYNIIDLSFYWSNTPQGHNYWSNLNSQWNKTIMNKNKTY